jgi:thiamine-monophosphate kinase
MDEFAIIARHFAPLATAPGAFGLTDDAAVIPARPGFDLVVTTDQIAEGTDFFKHDPAATIAQKALRVNLSDLAAKGASPEYYLLTIALPHGMTDEWLADFATGLNADQKHYGISLLGGDTSATEGPLAIGVTAFGFVPQGRMVKRSGARPGDAIYVTGSIGDSAGGLAIFRREKHSLTEAQRDQLIARYRVPEPPVDFGRRLAEFATASVDISDGLIADIGHLASASGMAVDIDAGTIPLSDALRAFWGEESDAILRAATSGDDYQIAFTGRPGLRGPFTCIGQVRAGEGVHFCVNGQEVVVPQPGYLHF